MQSIVKGDIPEPLKMVLRDYCHVEWYEVAELAAEIGGSSVKFDALALKCQLEDAIVDEHLSCDALNKLTGNEFESREQARSWLRKICAEVFP